MVPDVRVMTEEALQECVVKDINEGIETESDTEGSQRLGNLQIVVPRKDEESNDNSGDSQFEAEVKGQDKDSKIVASQSDGGCQDDERDGREDAPSESPYTLESTHHIETEFADGGGAGDENHTLTGPSGAVGKEGVKSDSRVDHEDEEKRGNEVQEQVGAQCGARFVEPAHENGEEQGGLQQGSRSPKYIPEADPVRHGRHPNTLLTAE